MRYFVNKFLISVLSTSLLITNTHAQSLKQRIESAYRTFETHESLTHGIASLTVINGNTGEIVFANNERIGLASASTLKNITAATAYHILGSSYRFKTHLYYTGEIDANGVLMGDIIINGSGDPTLGSDRYPHTVDKAVLQNWVEAIQHAGIRSVNGRIIANDNHFGGMTTPGTWSWQDMGNYYGTGVSSLNWQENAVGITFGVGSRVGDPTTILRTTSDISYLQLANETTTGRSGSGDNVYAFASPYSSRIYLRGTHGYDLKKTIQISLPDAAYHVSFQLHQAAHNAGIPTQGDPTTAHLLNLTSTYIPEDGTMLHQHLSPTLSEIVYWFNQKSINLYGEALLLSMANKTDEKIRTTSEAAIWLRDFWTDKLQLNPAEIRVLDGSGLSSGNRITTQAMARILSSVRREPWFESFYESIPTNNGMKMKSGTIGGVLGYAGYHTAADGTPLIFALLVNNYNGAAQPMRNRMFRLLNTLKN